MKYLSQLLFLILGVGKSSIINRYINDAYHPRNSATIGAFFYKRTFCIESFNLTLEVCYLMQTYF